MGIQSLDWEDPMEKEMANPLQYSCLGNPVDKGAWQAIVHRVEKKVKHNLVTKPATLASSGEISYVMTTNM